VIRISKGNQITHLPVKTAYDITGYARPAGSFDMGAYQRRP